jgi:glycine hydroxymethyltransferase
VSIQAISRAPDRRDIPTASEAYFDHVYRRLEGESTLQSVRWVEALASGHAAIRRTACLNLDPDEGALSKRCRALLNSDLGAGAAGRPRPQADFVEEVEATVVGLARRLFGAGFVEWRSSGPAAARRAVISALARPDEVVITLDGPGPDAAGPDHPRTLTIAQTTTFEPDLIRLVEVAARTQPRVIVIGGANVLFPQPLRELRRIADRSGGRLVYNADALGLLIAGGFQRPLEDGCDAVIVSTHGAMAGPAGALVMTDDPAVARQVAAAVTSGMTAVQDENSYAAMAVALGEIQTFAAELARRTVGNARALAAGLRTEGMAPVGARRGHTSSHQVIVGLGGDAEVVAARCDRANLRVAACALPGDRPGGVKTGLRLGVHEITRRGMGEAEMRKVAQIVAAVVLDQVDADQQIPAVADLLAPFAGLPFSFDAAP